MEKQLLNKDIRVNDEKFIRLTAKKKKITWPWIYFDFSIVASGWYIGILFFGIEFYFDVIKLTQNAPLDGPDSGIDFDEMTDEEIDQWVKEYNEWLDKQEIIEENKHGY